MKRSQKNDNSTSRSPPFIFILLGLIVFIVFTFFSGIVIGAVYAKSGHDIFFIGSTNHKDVDAGNGAFVKTNRIVPETLSLVTPNKEISSNEKFNLRKVESVQIQTNMNLVNSQSLSVTDMNIFGRISLHANLNAYMITPKNLDDDNILIAAWIYLDDNNVNNMRTIFSNKAAGCEHNTEQFGISMFVNAWETNDMKLYVEYGNSNSGCHKLQSEFVLSSRQWYHVAVYFNKDGSNMLLIDGISHHSQISSNNQNDVIAPLHAVQTNRPFYIGQYDESRFSLYGNISSLAFAHVNWIDLSLSPTSSTLEKENALKIYVDKYRKLPLAALTRISTSESHNLRLGFDKWLPKNMIAFYPLSTNNMDQRSAISNLNNNNLKTNKRNTNKKNTSAYDIVHNNHGKFQYASEYGGAVVHGINFPLINGLDSQSYDIIITNEDQQKFNIKCAERKQSVKQGMIHVWSSYRSHAWGADELKPLSKTRNNNWGSMGMTILDSLDTLWVMDMHDEFKEAMSWVQSSLSFHNAGSLSVFEVTIRALGGLLSAFSLSSEQIFLTKAIELGDLLLPAFKTQTGIPFSSIDFRSRTANVGWNGQNALLAELGTLQIEFRALSYYSKNKIYEEQCMRAMTLMYQKHPHVGLCPMKIDMNNGNFADNVVTVGAMGDSFYEYLLKVWIQGGKI